MVHLRHRNLLQTMAATIFPPFYRHRAARKQYFCHFIVTVRRGNNIFAFLSSPRSAGTIFSRFIVTARRGNDISAVSVLAVLLKYIPERFWLLQANCERSEMWREPRGDGGGPRAEGKMKSSHSKWNDCFLF